MPFLEEPFNQNRIDTIKRYLQREKDKGRAKDYEIQIDGFKVVPRTNNIAEFEDYELELKSDSCNVSFLIFDGANTNRNTRYSLRLLAASALPQSKNALNGTDEKSVATLLKEKLEERDKEYELEKLHEKINDLTEQLSESEAWSAQLEQQVQELQNGQHKKVVGLGELAGYVLDGFVKRNPQILNKLPAGEALSGLLGLNDSTNVMPPNAPTEASFSKKTDSPQLTDDQKGWLEFGQQVQTTLNQTQTEHVFHILQHFKQQPELIPLVLDLLQQQNPSKQL
jgi:hypothetical protein